MPAAGGYWQAVSPRAWPAWWASRATTASADPVFPHPPRLLPRTVTQTVTAHAGAPRPPRSPPGKPASRPPCRAAQSATAPGIDTRRRGAGNPAACHLGDAAPTSSRRRASHWSRRTPRDFKALNIVLPVPTRLEPGARSERSRRVRGARRPGRRRRAVHLQRGSSSSTSWSAGLRSARRPSPTATSKPAADRRGVHQCVAGRLRRHAVVGHRGHLPAEQHDAQHVASAHHRDRGPGQVPGDAVGDHHRQEAVAAAPPPTPSPTGSRSAPSTPRLQRGPQACRRRRPDNYSAGAAGARPARRVPGAPRKVSACSSRRWVACAPPPPLPRLVGGR